MNKRQVKKYCKRNYCWTYKEHKTGNIYAFMQWEGTRSGKSKVLLHNGSKGTPWVSRNHRVYSSEVLKEACEQFNKDVLSGKYSNIVTYSECDHPTSQSFEIQTVGRLTI
jgi:hypothetical protein